MQTGQRSVHLSAKAAKTTYMQIARLVGVRWTSAHKETGPLFRRAPQSWGLLSHQSYRAVGSTGSPGNASMFLGNKEPQKVCRAHVEFYKESFDFRNGLEEIKVWRSQNNTDLWRLWFYVCRSRWTGPQAVEAGLGPPWRCSVEVLCLVFMVCRQWKITHCSLQDWIMMMLEALMGRYSIELRPLTASLLLFLQQTFDISSSRLISWAFQGLFSNELYSAKYKRHKNIKLFLLCCSALTLGTTVPE